MIQTSRSIEFPLAGTTRRTNKGPTQSQLMILFFPSILRYPYHELTYKAVSSVSNATIHRSGLSGLIYLWSFCNLIKFFPIDFSFYIVFSRGYFIPSFLILNYFAVVAIKRFLILIFLIYYDFHWENILYNPPVSFWHFSYLRSFFPLIGGISRETRINSYLHLLVRTICFGLHWGLVCDDGLEVWYISYL